ncbi:MAG: V-type ATP synthase subunit I [Clostridiales bacterium]|nr:V-type ATP synthase subunit I [Clostridiales bacterium]
MSIVKMKRVRLLALARDQEALLAQLERLGCVEISEPSDKLADPDWTALLGRNTSSLGQVKGQLNELSAALDALKKYAGVKGSSLKPRTKIQEEDLFDPDRLADALGHARAINDSVSTITQLNSRENQLNAQRASLVPWTSLDLPLETGSTENVEIVMGALPATSSLDDLRGELDQAAPLSQVIPVSADKEQQYILLLCHKSQWADAQAAMKPYSFTATRFDKALTGTATENIARTDQALTEVAAQRQAEIEKIKTHSDCLSALQVITDRLNQDAARESARERAMTDGTIIFLEGWVPAPKLNKVQKVLDSFDAAYSFRDPEEGDDTPTQLDNPKWMDCINMVTEMYSLPAYNGIDPNPLYFFWYVFFFGFMFADVAYGIIIMVVSLIVIKTINPKKTMGRMFHLGVWLGASTAFCGVFVGGFFGNALEVIYENFIPGGTAAMPGWMVTFCNGIIVNPVNDPMTVLIIAVVIGCFHLLMGQCIHIYMGFRDGTPVDALLDVVPWWIVFVGIGAIVLAGTPVVLILGVVVLICTQGRHAPSFFGKLWGGISSLYDITSWLSDVLSYARLMALMLATSVIAQVFNTLGALPRNILVFIIVFLIGHVFNIGVNLIGTYVHAARLQYLEYFNKFYISGGIPFRPLKYDTKYTDILTKEEN